MRTDMVDMRYSDAIDGHQVEIIIDALFAERELEGIYFVDMRAAGVVGCCPCGLVSDRTQPRSALSMPRMPTQAWLTWRDNNGRDDSK
jgi:hypothetical protein